MSFVGELRRSYRAGRASAKPSDFSGDGFDHEEPHGFAGDELAESKAVIAGLLEENVGLEAQLAQLAINGEVAGSAAPKKVVEKLVRTAGCRSGTARRARGLCPRPGMTFFLNFLTASKGLVVQRRDAGKTS
jgi:hypothetical protein